MVMSITSYFSVFHNSGAEVFTALLHYKPLLQHLAFQLQEIDFQVSRVGRTMTRFSSPTQKSG